MIVWAGKPTDRCPWVLPSAFLPDAAMRRLSPLLLLLACSPAFAQPPKPELPRVLLVGDSIRLGYAPLVAKKLAGKAEVISIPDNFADTATTLKMLDKVLEESKP